MDERAVGLRGMRSPPLLKRLTLRRLVLGRLSSGGFDIVGGMSSGMNVLGADNLVNLMGMSC
jgi:hypothetical protein